MAIFPNFTLHELVCKVKRKVSKAKEEGIVEGQTKDFAFAQFLNKYSSNLSMEEIEFMLNRLRKKKEEMQVMDLIVKPLMNCRYLFRN